MRLLFLAILLFSAGVGVTAVIKDCTIKEATLKCKNFCKEIINALFQPTPVPEVFYPVDVGFDGNRIVPQLVDDEFSKISENFASCYCIKGIVIPDGSLVQYAFSIMRKQDSMDDEYLEKLIQKQTEEVVAHTMRRYDFYLPTEPLTYVELQEHRLLVAFARNDAGIKKLDNKKRAVRRRKIEAAHTSHSNLTENWEDREKK